MSQDDTELTPEDLPAGFDALKPEWQQALHGELAAKKARRMNDEDYGAIEFGRHLGDMIRVRGIRQAELARRSGMSDASISRFISGGRRPSLDALLDLIRALKATMEEVFKLIVALSDKKAAVEAKREKDPPSRKRGRPKNSKKKRRG